MRGIDLIDEHEFIAVYQNPAKIYQTELPRKIEHQACFFRGGRAVQRDS